MIRPQDLATKGSGKLRYDGEDTLLGSDTAFKSQVQPRDLIAVGKTIKLAVAEVISDTEIKLSAPLSDEEKLGLKEDVSYKILPHVDQSVLYEKVHARLAERGSIVIFPEGGSHDRTEMLPLKGDCQNTVFLLFLGQKLTLFYARVF